LAACPPAAAAALGETRVRFALLLKGLAIGVAIAAPVGPIGVLCIRRSLLEGRRLGFVTGMGAATADAFYGCVAAFGLTAISGALVGLRAWLGLAGGLFLCGLGVRTFRSIPATQAVPIQGRGLLRAYLSTVFLTLTNPLTILSFVAVFAGLGLGAAPDDLAAGALVSGVFIGSALWWLLLSSGASALQSRVGSDGARAINRLSGCIICAFGIYSLSTAWSG
jgi:threonine/homoserine/homoserine lactone efflux protein